MKEITLGQYYPSNSIVHRMDARIKLVLSVMYITMIFFIKSFTGFAFVALLILFSVFISKVPLLKVLKSIRAILFLVIFTMLMSMFFYSSAAEEPLFSWGIFKLYKAGIINAVLMAIRLILLVLGPSILTLTTTPTELTDGLESLLTPLKWIRLPVHELAIIMSIALRLVPTLVDETDKIMNAQKARGASFDTGNIFKRAKSLLPILIPLFVSSFRRADELAYAMDSRCYRGAKGRTRMKVFKVGVLDILALLFLAAFFFCILMLRYNWWGFAFIGMLI